MAGPALPIVAAGLGGLLRPSSAFAAVVSDAPSRAPHRARLTARHKGAAVSQYGRLN